MFHQNRLLLTCATLISVALLSENLTCVHAQEQLTSILFTVVDKNNNPVTILRKEDIRVLEDDVPQEITGFQQQVDRALSLVILIDASASQEKTLPAEKAAALSFVDSIIHPDRDMAAVISFTDDAILKQSLTNDRTQVRQAIDNIKFVSPRGPGATAIWDAIWAACEEIVDLAPGQTRRVIILLTDGVDTASRKKMSEAVNRTIKSEAVIYSIGIGDTTFNGVDKGALERVAERTGGRAFFPRKDKNLPAIFTALEQSLRSQYLVSYSPKSKKTGNSFRKVRIEIVNPELRQQNLQLFYQQGYFTKS